MTENQFARALRAVIKRRPFRPFLIEFSSGDRLHISHPETINREGELFVHRSPDRGHRIFAASSVCQLIDPPPPPQNA